MADWLTVRLTLCSRQHLKQYDFIIIGNIKQETVCPNKIAQLQTKITLIQMLL